MKNNSIRRKVLNFPVTRILLGSIVVIGLFVVMQALLYNFANSLELKGNILHIIGSGVPALLCLFSYLLFFKWYEKRKINELALKHSGKNLFWGFILGCILQSLTIGVIYFTSSYSIISINHFTLIFPALIMAFTTAITEEILLRGILFRILEEKLGSYIALGISALVFGLLHLGNPNSSIIAALGLAVQAGVLLGATYIYSRSLWMPIALHFAWNFMQSGIFGAAVSGGSTKNALITSHIEGTTWITGGDFGPEGSIQATLFCLIAAVIILYRVKKNNQFISPFWKA
ncbi:CPBP family intramembrane metalloprotease [Prolixibacteraceae bacterium JC049]|nr:CPBP family intramembrane metalloprotease [Prolixibacteraceae bacterium JC049]